MGIRLKTHEALKVMLSLSGKSIAEVSRRIGTKTPSNLSQMITNESIRMRVGAAVCEACGYKLVLVPKDTDLGDNVIEIAGEV